MANIATQPAPRDEHHLATGPAIEDHRPISVRLPRFLGWLWLAASGLLIGFLLLGAVRIGAGSWTGWRMSLVRIWSRFRDYLVDQGASGGLIILVATALVLAVAGCVVLLYFAFSLRDNSADSQSADELNQP